MDILVGNSFPLSLIKRKVVIIPQNIEEFKKVLYNNNVFSFWGHKNSLVTANNITGADLTPEYERPSLLLTNDGYIEFNNYIFKQCWVLSPNYIVGFRPVIGEEVTEDKITGWQVLQMIWE